ncbi:MAG: hypothetical protein JRI23_18200 [Deltaproteobacteria bacterium]|nr:hypothetical protein [Deltaproteobacteria bacterium]MBW2533787.1 hypothetical protein [Deltaproteobacteria bacterium]
MVLGLWVAVHRVSWLGPLVANTLRSIIGVQAVTDLEETAYGLQDRWNRFWRDGEQPEAYWEVPERTAATPPPVATTEAGCTVPAFALENVGPVHDSWSAPGDGVWVPIADPQHPTDSPRMLKTLLHPDRIRSWAAVSVVAVDLRTVDLHLMAGSYEPKNSTKEAFKYERKAIIAPEAQGELLGAFNGGFRAEHGHYGMRVDGVTLVQPRRLSCYIGKYGDDQLRVGDWKKHEDTAADAVWWRQTPGCMVDDGELHPGLRAEKNTYWGATLDGDTIIRRSALGLSADGRVLYVGIGDFTTAKVIAVGMRHAGARYVAQLDVNWSYPKFVLYQPREEGSRELYATPLCKGFEFSEDEYVRKRADRDFFYLTRKPQPRIEASVCGEE